jgi:Na+-transporting methylmalonyl-CoA/oxaloacetate decarboxylase gamma subunit
VALSDDQKAILRLLAQRGVQGYDDLAALMGISVGEVHARAKQAAAELEAEGIPAPEIPAPKASEAAVPSEKKKAEPVVPIPRHEHGHGPKELAHEAKLLENRGLWAILAGVAIVVVFVVILLVSSSGGGSDSNSTTAASTSSDNCKVESAPKPNGKILTALAAAAVKSSKEVTRAVLNPIDGSEARGLAVFGRVKKSLALQVAAEGLAPSSDCGYTIWIAASPKKMLPLASTEVQKDGRINAQVEVPVEVLAYLANETFGQIAITRTDESQLKASLAQATKKKEAPLYTGTEVLRGAVKGPIVGAAKK